MATRRRELSLLLFVALCSVAVKCTYGALFAVDMGSQNIKIAMLKQGRPIEIVLNEQTKRKTPNVVSFAEDGERMFSENAKNKLSSKPTRTFAMANRLLGQALSSPIVKTVSESLKYPYKLSEDEARGSVVLHHDDSQFTPEELVGMVLNYARELSKETAGSDVRDVVITVPPYFTQVERLAMVDAAQLAGLNVLSVVNTNLAVAVQYGIQKDMGLGTNYVLIFDVGHSDTIASVVRYTQTNVSVGRKNKTVSALEVVGVGYDDNLGSGDLDMCIAKMFAKEFEAKHKGSGNIMDTPRTMARLRKEAEKTKQVLSANTETTTVIEGLHDDIDFKMKLSRATFEEGCAEFFERLTGPIERALKDANITKEEFAAIELFGGGTRVPKVKEIILETMGRTALNHSLNTDESAVMGAAFFAANVSTEFRVRDYRATDLNGYSIGVKLVETVEPDVVVVPEAEEEPVAEGEEGEDKEKEEKAAKKEKTLSGTLYPQFKPFPSKKAVSMRRSVDFGFEVYYSEPDQLPPGVAAPIALFNVTGIDQLNKYNFTGKPKVSVTFAQTPSGLVEVLKADASIDEIYQVKDRVCVDKNETDAEEPVVAAAGEDVGDVDTAKDGEKAGDEAPAEDADKDASADADADANADAENKAEEKTEDKATEGDKEEDGADADKADDKAEGEDDNKADADADKEPETVDDDNVASKNATTTAEKKKKKKPAKVCHTETRDKKRVRRAVLRIERTSTGSIKAFDSEGMKAAKDRLKELNRLDKIRERKSQARNDIESHVYETRDRMSEEPVQAVSTEEQREKITKMLTDAEDWLYEGGMEANIVELDTRLEELRAESDPIFYRVKESEALPEAVKALYDYLRKVKKSVDQWKEKRPQVTEEERDDLMSKVGNARLWLEDMEEQQGKRKAHESPVLQSSEIEGKVKEIKKEVAKLERKPKPKPKKPVKLDFENETAANGTDSKAGGDNTTRTDGGAKGDEAPTKDGQKAEDESTNEEAPTGGDKAEGSEEAGDTKGEADAEPAADTPAGEDVDLDGDKSEL